LLADFLGAIKDGDASPITPAEIFAVTRATFAVLESLRQRSAVFVEPQINTDEKS